MHPVQGHHQDNQVQLREEHTQVSNSVEYTARRVASLRLSPTSVGFVFHLFQCRIKADDIFPAHGLNHWLVTSRFWITGGEGNISSKGGRFIISGAAFPRVPQNLFHFYKVEEEVLHLHL